tara:strand:- start:1913 stop:2140 length:228 start_codon:yes stop_codon:yes gene_type:complete
MAITNKQLSSIGFTMLKGSKNMIRAVGNDLMLTASQAHMYLNGAHLINMEFIDLAFLGKYIEKVIQAKRKTDASK